MRCTITIEMDNAAFEDHSGVELACILKGAARKLEAFQTFDEDSTVIHLRDTNGNTVGKLEVS